MGWRDRYGFGSAAPVVAAPGDWEDDPTSPLRERRLRAGGGYEYRPKAGAMGDAPVAVGPLEDPYENNETAGLPEQIGARLRDLAGFAMDLPSTVATIDRAIARTVPRPLAWSAGLGPAVEAARESTLPEDLAPSGVLGDVRASLAEQSEAAKDRFRQSAVLRGGSPVGIALAEGAMDLTLDPTQLVGIGLGGEAVEQAGRQLPRWMRRFAPAREAAREALAAKAADLAALRDGALEQIDRATAATAHLPEPSFPPAPAAPRVLEGLDLPAPRSLPPLPRVLAPHEMPRGIGTRAEQDIRLGLRARTPEDAEELARTALSDTPAPPARSYDELADETMARLPPPRVPLEDLPDPAGFPLRDFEQLSPLPPPVTAAVHREGVEQAVAAGERVRPAVLRDYPDLGADVAVAAARPGERGHVKIPAGPSFLNRWFRKDGDFEALGELRGWAFERSITKDAEISAGMRKVKDTLRDFDLGVREAMRQSSLTADQIFEYVEAGLKGENDLSGIPPKLRGAAEEMRIHWDRAAEEYVQRTDLPQALREHISANRGFYYPRHFRAHEDADWGRLVDPASPDHDPREAWRWDRYMDWAKEERTRDAAELYPGASASGPDGRVGEVVRVGAQAKESMAAVQADPSYQNFPIPSIGGGQSISARVSQVSAPARAVVRAQFQAGAITWEQARQAIRAARQNAAVQVWVERGQQAAAKQLAIQQRRELRQQLFEAHQTAHAEDVLLRYDDGTSAALQRPDVANTVGMARWTDDELSAYGQHLLHGDPDAFVGFTREVGVVGRENRGNLRRRIVADVTVDDLPPDLAQKVAAGKLSLDGAVIKAKEIPGWWDDYMAHQPGLPEQLENLLGLHKDPSLRYRSSMLRTLQDQAVFKLHRDLAAEGAEEIFFSRRQPGHFVQIGGKGPLAEKFTSPEIAAVIRGSQGTAKAFHGWVAGLYEGWKKVRAGVTIGKTTLNFPAGHMRNAAAWPFVHLAEGHFGAATNPLRPLSLLPYQVADKASAQQGALAAVGKRMADMVELADGTRLGDRWTMRLEELRPEIEFLHSQGVFGQSAHGADLRHYEGVLGYGKTSREAKALGRAVDIGRSLWEGGDDMGKHISFRANLQNLLWARGKMGVAESLPIDYWTRPEFADEITEAAKRTRLATPTGSMIAPAVRELRNLPAGPFPGWTAEQFRNAKENVRIGLADLKDPNPRMKVLGAKRLGGFIASAALGASMKTGMKAGKWALLGGGVAGAVNLARGTDDDPGDALRSFLAPWSRDSEIAVTEVERDGKVRSVDLSTLIPSAAFMDGISAILRSIQSGENYWDGFLDSVKETLNPFFDEEIVVSTLLDLARNQKGSGWFEAMMNEARSQPHKAPDYKVYDAHGDRTRKAKQVLYHFWRGLGPAGLAGLQGERTFRAALQENQDVREAFADLTHYDRALSVQDEVAGMMGLRFTTTDVSRSVARQGGDYVRARIDISSDYTRRRQPAGLAVASPERTLALKKEANEDGRRAYEIMVRTAADALRLGYNQEQLRRWLEKGNVGRKHRSALIQDALRRLKGEAPAFYVPVVP